KVLQNTVARMVAGLSFAPGPRLVAGGSGGFDVWDLASEGRAHVPTSDARYLWACACDPLGRWFYAADSTLGCRLYDLAHLGERPLPGAPRTRHVISLAVSGDGTRLALSRGGAGFNRLECWSVQREGRFTTAWGIRNGEKVDLLGTFFLENGGW